MATDEERFVSTQFRNSAREKLSQIFFCLLRRSEWNSNCRQRRVRLSSLRVNVVHAMVRSDAPEQKRIVEKRAEEIHRLQEDLPGRHVDRRNILSGIDAKQHVGCGVEPDAVKGTRKDAAADLPTAATAAHWDFRLGHVHFGKLLILPHPTAIDPIFDGPNPGAFHRPEMTRSDGVLITGADNTKKL